MGNIIRNKFLRLVPFNYAEVTTGKCGQQITQTQCDEVAKTKYMKTRAIFQPVGINVIEGCFYDKTDEQVRFNQKNTKPEKVDCSSQEICICRKSKSV